MTMIPIEITLNGRQVQTQVAAEDTMIDLLRRLDTFGARESCGQGLCGCCTVLIDGIAVSGCLELAALANGRKIDTVEGLDSAGELSVVQQAFIDEGAFQCGFCTSGFILMAEQLLEQNQSPTDDDIRDYMAGNLCRCAAYPEIIRAVSTAAKRRSAASL